MRAQSDSACPVTSCDAVPTHSSIPSCSVRVVYTVAPPCKTEGLCGNQLLVRRDEAIHLVRLRS